MRSLRLRLLSKLSRIGETCMVRSYDGETILRNLLWDVDRMIKEGKKHEEVLALMETKIAWLKNPTWEKINWWDEGKVKRKKRTVEVLNEENEEGYPDEVYFR